MTPTNKLRVARALAELNVDLIEAGFPAASPGEFESVRLIATEIQGPIVSALARCCSYDIEQVLDALEPRAPTQARVHLFLATSPIHRVHKLNLSREEVLDRARDAIILAKKSGNEVQFSLEDSTRTEEDFLDETIDMAVESGAKIICLPDTVGASVPESYAALFRRAAARIPTHVTLAAHCHNDLGLALANSLAACQSGARQVECTLNGIGERAGNTALEEFVMALKVRADHYGLHTRVNCQGLSEASRLLSKVTDLPMARNKPIVGRNVFTTSAGIHQDGLLKEPKTYLLFPPEAIGATMPAFHLTKHSGRAALRNRLRQLGIRLEEGQFSAIFKAFLERADFQIEVTDQELLSMSKDVLIEEKTSECATTDF